MVFLIAFIIELVVYNIANSNYHAIVFICIVIALLIISLLLYKIKSQQFINLICVALSILLPLLLEENKDQ